MRQSPSNADPETYKLKITTFENGKPEESLAVMKNFTTAIDRTGTMFAGDKDILYTYSITWGSTLRIWETSNP